MKNIYFLMTIILLTFSCKNNNPEEKQAVQPKDTVDINRKQINDVIEIQAQLIDRLDTIMLPPPCGTVLFDITLKYTVIKIIRGYYTNKTILIYHICPKEIIENKVIEQNKIYTYKLKRRFKIRDSETGQNIVDAGDYEIIN